MDKNKENVYENMTPPADVEKPDLVPQVNICMGGAWRIICMHISAVLLFPLHIANMSVPYPCPF